MKYAIKVPFGDDCLYVTETDEYNLVIVKTYDTQEDAEKRAKLWNNSTVVEYTEVDRLQAKKQAIKEELYDKVKMEMFKASSKLEGIDYEDKEVPCKEHPDAPHGFDRNSSLSLGRYVCECENWEPDWEPENPVREIVFWDDLKIEPEGVLIDPTVEGKDITKPAELKRLLEEMCDRMDRIEYGDDDLS